MILRLVLKPEAYPELKTEMKVSVVSEIEKSFVEGDVIITILSSFPIFYYRGKNTRHLSESETDDLVRNEIENGIKDFIRYHCEQMRVLRNWFICEKFCISNSDFENVRRIVLRIEGNCKEVKINSFYIE